MPATWDEIRGFALTLPHTEETTWDRMPAVQVHDRAFLHLRPVDETVVILCTLTEKLALLESRDPAMSTVSKDNVDTILLRLKHAELDNEVEEIITEAWRIAEAQARAQ